MYTLKITDQYVGEIVTRGEDNRHRSHKYQFVYWFLYCPPENKKRFNLNFYKGFERGDKLVRNRNSNHGFLIKGDFNCTTGKRQLQLPLLFDVWEKWNTESYNFAK